MRSNNIQELEPTRSCNDKLSWCASWSTGKTGFPGWKAFGLGFDLKALAISDLLETSRSLSR
jgi:hypothetical protein